MMGVVSYVMARKGILISNPDVKAMTKVQWLFEYNSLAKKEKDIAQVSVKILKGLLINVLGLNALKPEDESGNPKTFENMTQEEKEGFLPLIAWCGRPELLKKVSEQIEKTDLLAEIPKDSKYEDLVAAIDAAGGDMEPILDSKFNISREDITNGPPVVDKQTNEELGIKDISEMKIDFDSEI